MACITSVWSLFQARYRRRKKYHFKPRCQRLRSIHDFSCNRSQEQPVFMERCYKAHMGKYDISFHVSIYFLFVCNICRNQLYILKLTMSNQYVWNFFSSIFLMNSTGFFLFFALIIYNFLFTNLIWMSSFEL